MLDWFVKEVDTKNRTLVLGESERLVAIDLLEAAKKCLG
jgi:hypothetical protein